MRSRGSVYAWAVVVIGLFVLGIAIIPLWYIYTEYKAIMANYVDMSDENISTVMSFIDTLWFLVPVLILIGLILWAYVYSVKREPYSY